MFTALYRTLYRFLFATSLVAFVSVATPVSAQTGEENIDLEVVEIESNIPAIGSEEETTESESEVAETNEDIPESSFGFDDIEEVVVTVERREQSLQDVAGTAASFDGEELKLLGVQNINDLDGSLPGLAIANNSGNIEVYIRGVGSDNNTELGDPAAATHLDGVYVPRPAGFGAAFFDIDRVEVNVGPQGTLRGRNATAGSINVIPFKPGIGQTDGAVELSLGTYNEQQVSGVVNISLGNNTAIRLAGFAMQHDSYYNIMNPSDAIGNGIATSEAEGIVGAEAADDTGVRLSFLTNNLFGTSGLSLGITLDAITQQGTGYTGTNYASALAAGIDPDSVNPRDVYVRPITPAEDTSHSGAKIQLTYATDALTFEYNLSQRDLVYDYQWGGAADTVVYDGALTTSLNNGTAQEDFDFDVFSRVGQITDSVSNIHELRLFSDTLPVQWTTGIFIFEETQRTFLGSAGDKNVYYFGNEFNQRTSTDSLSFYGDATYWANDRFRATAGLRFTNDQKERTGINIRYNRFIGLGNAFWGNYSGAPRAGSDGFEFAAFDRPHLNPDTNGDSMLSTQEIAQFYLEGIAAAGERDTITSYASYLIELHDALNALTPDGGTLVTAIGGGDDGTIAAHEYQAPRAAGSLRLSCADLAAYVVDFACPTGAGPAAGYLAYTFANASVFAFQDGTLDNSFFDWRMRGEYDITDDSLIYGLVATGHKSGGFNDNLPNVTVTAADSGDPNTPPVVTVTFNGDGPVPTYREESLMLFELGSKNEFQAGEMRYTFNASVFVYDYENLQLTNLVSSAQILDFANIPSDAGEDADRQAIDAAGATDNIVSFTFNAADAAISGLQLDGDFRFPNRMTVAYNLLWLNQATVQDSVQIQDSRFGPEVQQDECLPRNGDGDLLEPLETCNARLQPIEGHRLPRTPEIQAKISVSQSILLGNGHLDWITSLGYRSDQYMTIFNSRVYNDSLSDLERLRLNDEVSGYWTLDVGAGYTLQTGSTELRFEGYINNLTDEQKAQAITITQRDNRRFFSRPQTIGFRVRALF
ncbi:MAG: TonB-dependent receptor domain-containing protein [Gammaproteobacteria bacterium]